MTRQVNPALKLGIGAVLLAAVFGLLAVVDGGRIGPEPSPPMPLTVASAVTPFESRATLAPRGGRIERSGRLTILAVPERHGTLAPRQKEKPGPDERARPVAPVPGTVMAGIRAFYRANPLPREELERPIVTTLEFVLNRAPLVLVDGCFRFGAKGPLAVFPAASRLGMVDGYLVVGPPGLPARTSARIGEDIAWEGKPLRCIAQAGKDKVRERCGPGEVIAVSPWSASVRKAESDSWRAAEISRRLGVGFADAVRMLCWCGDPARQAIRGGPVSKPSEACQLARPQPPAPPRPPPLPQRR